MEQEQIISTVDWLIDDWCEVRKLAALRHVLPVYPMKGSAARDWAALRDALREVQSACGAELSARESEALRELVAATGNLAAR